MISRKRLGGLSSECEEAAGSEDNAVYVAEKWREGDTARSVYCKRSFEEQHTVLLVAQHSFMGVAPVNVLPGF